MEDDPIGQHLPSLHRDLDVRLSVREGEDVKDAISLIENNSLDIKKLVTHKFPIDKSVEAFQCAIENNNAVKVMITGIR